MSQEKQKCSQGASKSEQDRRPVVSRQVTKCANPPAVVDEDDDSSLSSVPSDGDGAPRPSASADDAEEGDDDGDGDGDEDDDMAALMLDHLAQAAIDRGTLDVCHEHRRMAWWSFRTFETCNQSVVPCPVPGCDWKFPNLCGAPKPQQRHFLACHMPLTPADLAELASAPPSLRLMKPQWARAKVAAWSLHLHGADIPYLKRLFPVDMESELMEWTPFQEA